MKIKVLGEGCKKCSELYDNTKEAISLLGIDADLEKVEDLIEIVKLGVMASPSLMVDGKLLISGRVASVKTILKLLQK